MPVLPLRTLTLLLVVSTFPLIFLLYYALWLVTTQWEWESDDFMETIRITDRR